jgi:tRNA threonylcarbamoyladenosine biosynthesis protein TsaB
VSYILHIETATTVCSVALSQNENLLFYKEINEGFTHAENLHLFIEEALKSCHGMAAQLNASAVSKGPGSYTGLRIGVSAAKGLAYALHIPLLSVDTLQIMAKAASVFKKEPGIYCPMIDARRMEVYTTLYDENLESLQAIEALIVDEASIDKFNTGQKIYFFGDGMQKCKPLLEKLKNATFIDQIYPSAQHMVELIYTKFLAKEDEDLAYFEPFYLKDFMILKKKSLL